MAESPRRRLLWALRWSCQALPLGPDPCFCRFVFTLSGLSLAMTGPSAWSIDARLFGRKQIDPSDSERASDRARKW